jgi:hypothetical protein
MKKKDLEHELKWALDQLLYYLKNPMDTEASKVWDRVSVLKHKLYR